MQQSFKSLKTQIKQKNSSNGNQTFSFVINNFSPAISKIENSKNTLNYLQQITPPPSPPLSSKFKQNKSCIQVNFSYEKGNKEKFIK